MSNQIPVCLDKFERFCSFHLLFASDGLPNSSFCQVLSCGFGQPRHFWKAGPFPFFCDPPALLGCFDLGPEAMGFWRMLRRFLFLLTRLRGYHPNGGAPCRGQRHTEVALRIDWVRGRAFISGLLLVVVYKIHPGKVIPLHYPSFFRIMILLGNPQLLI